MLATVDHQHHTSQHSSSQHRSTRSSVTGSESTGTVDVSSGSNGYGFRGTDGSSLSIEVSFLNPRRRFPLADEFLPRVYIKSEKIAELKQVCEEMIAHALEKTAVFAWDGSDNRIIDATASKQWKTHYSRQNLTLYRQRNEKGGDSALRHFLARGQVHSMTLQDVEYGMYCDNTVDERAVMTDLYQDAFMDAAVLKVFERFTTDDPFHFFGIKWLAVVSPADKFVSPRDYAFVEYSKRIVNKKGEPVLVKVVQSLNSDLVTSMNQREFDLVRGVLSCTYIYRYDAPTKNVQVFAQGYMDPCGKTKGFLCKSFLTQFAPTIVTLEHSADVKYIMRNGLVMTGQAFQQKIATIKSQKKKQCIVCSKGFGMMKRHYTHCRACGEVVCSRCYLALTLCLPHHEKRSAEHPSAVVEEKFCFKCLYSGRLDRNGRPMDRIYQKLAGIHVDDDNESLMTPMQHGMHNMSMNDDELEQVRVQNLRLRHLEQEKRKNLAQTVDVTHYGEDGSVVYHPKYSSASSSSISSYEDGNSFSSNSVASNRQAPLSISELSTSTATSSFDAAAQQQLERSIAEQEALIRSIQSERVKLASRKYIHASALRNNRAGYTSSSTSSGVSDRLALPPSETASTSTTVSSSDRHLGRSWD